MILIILSFHHWQRAEQIVPEIPLQILSVCNSDNLIVGLALFRFLANFFLLLIIYFSLRCVVFKVFTCGSFHNKKKNETNDLF